VRETSADPMMTAQALTRRAPLQWVPF